MNIDERHITAIIAGTVRKTAVTIAIDAVRNWLRENEGSVSAN